ncbi:MAG TPA: HAMP domain-containing sensor histidine kinase, partial [Kineosporiaceae bacterium]|nr:HAMP domain-containing sensor histidine kinase [Kineosporiaceae bacterium]
MRLLRTAARRNALVASALVAVVTLAVVGLTAWLMLAEQSRQVDDLLTQTAAVVDDVRDPPPASWEVLTRNGRTSLSPGLPPALGAALAAVREHPPAPGRAVLTEIRMGEGYRVVTRTTSDRGDVVQVVVAESRWTADRDRIMAGAGLTALVGLGMAAVAGLALGHRAVRPLGDALALQRRFVADASHELRTPLTLLSTRAQVVARQLEREGADDPRAAQARGVVRDVRRLADALDDLLIAATPGVQGELVDADLGEIARDVVDSARDHAAAEGVELVLTPGPAVATCVPTSARRALLALVDNAIGHTPRGGVVRVDARAGREGVLVAVHDTGPGIGAGAGAGAPRPYRAYVAAGA